MRVLVILNQAAGTLSASTTRDEPERIRAGFEAAGVEVDVRTVEGGQLADTARQAGAEGFDAVVAGGGDGTLNTIANALVGGPVAFAVLPLGTYNHFAKELNVPFDLDEAIAALARGTATDLDVAEVNGHVFLSVSGLGLHPMLVKHRDAQRTALGRRKIVAMFVAFLKALTRLPVMRIKLRFGDTVLRRVTPSVVICNNVHQLKAFGVEEVAHTGRDALNVFLARSTSWWGVAWLAIRAAFRRIESARKFEVIVLPEFTIETPHRHARVTVDGEVTDFHTPLHYRLRRGGLKVIMPSVNGEETRRQGDKGK